MTVITDSCPVIKNLFKLSFIKLSLIKYYLFQYYEDEDVKYLKYTFWTDDNCRLRTENKQFCDKWIVRTTI